ncbi:MAG: DinB family protein [Paracoccaceae bacterium]
MARYNMWQNNQLMDILDVVEEVELTKNHGAFFGSIFSTLNHLMWGDMFWMSNFGQGSGPTCSGKDSVILHPNYAAWRAERIKLDAQIVQWAENLTDEDLKGDVTWPSFSLGRDVSKPTGPCVAGFFNHQTHHRGQVHAMLTASDLKAPVTDLVFMPGLQ